MPKTPDRPKTKNKKSKSKTREKTRPASSATEEQKIQDLAKKYCKPLPDEEQQELKEALQDEFDLDDVAELDSEELWKAVAKSENYLVIEKASVLHKKGLRGVWKMYNFVTSSEKNFLTYMPQVLKRAGIEKITAKFDPLNATFRSVIKTDDRRIASRGAQAIRWAEHEEQTPDTVVDFEGGVDSWAKHWQDHCGKQKEAAGGKVKQKMKTAAAALAKLRSNLKDGDKAVLMVKLVGSKLVSQGHRNLPNGKVQYWPLIDAAIAKPKSAKSKSSKG